MPNILARTIKRHWIIRWGMRAIGILFVWTSITLPATAHLTDTALVHTLTTEYNSWVAFFSELLLGALTLGLLAAGGKIILHLANRYHVSKKNIARLAHFDERLFKNFLSFDFFLTRWAIALTLSAALWWIVLPRITLITDTIRTPIYDQQPVIVVLGILGLSLLIDSIEWWQVKLHHYFHLNIRL